MSSTDFAVGGLLFRHLGASALESIMARQGEPLCCGVARLYGGRGRRYKIMSDDNIWMDVKMALLIATRGVKRGYMGTEAGTIKTSNGIPVSIVTMPKKMTELKVTHNRRAGNELASLRRGATCSVARLCGTWRSPRSAVAYNQEIAETWHDPRLV